MGTPIPAALFGRQGGRMKTRHRLSLQPQGRLREPEWNAADQAENRLFDACCEVLEAAHELQGQAEDNQSAGAAVAAMGCLSAALEALAASAGSMRDGVIGTDAIRPHERRKAVAQRLEEARAGLRRAAAACGPAGSWRPRDAPRAREAWRL
jgi:hypothetical protein